jgi:hypothetical protein
LVEQTRVGKKRGSSEGENTFATSQGGWNLRLVHHHHLPAISKVDLAHEPVRFSAVIQARPS